eukprot:scaffold149_cov315-Pinguiococcus_pyrenoidosus.AAC.146
MSQRRHSAPDWTSRTCATQETAAKFLVRALRRFPTQHAKLGLRSRRRTMELLLPAIYRQYPLPADGKRDYPRAVLKHGVFHEGQPKVRSREGRRSSAQAAMPTAPSPSSIEGSLRLFTYFVESIPAAVGEFTVRKLTLFVKRGERELHRQNTFLSSSPETELPKLVLSAFEEHLPNSGLPQGKFLSEVPFPEHLSLEDLKIGAVIDIFGRKMRIYDMDAYTRGILGESAPPEVPIEDAHAYTLKHVTNSASILSQIRPTCLPALELSRKAKAPEIGTCWFLDRQADRQTEKDIPTASSHKLALPHVRHL